MKQNRTVCIEAAVYTVEEIQQLLGISRKTAYDLVRDPPFPVRKIMNQYRIPKVAFHAWLEKTTLDDQKSDAAV